MRQDREIELLIERIADAFYEGVFQEIENDREIEAFFAEELRPQIPFGALNAQDHGDELRAYLAREISEIRNASVPQRIHMALQSKRCAVAFILQFGES